MSSLLFVNTFLVLLLTLPTPSPAASTAAGQWQASTPQGMLMEDKIRLGSTPPSCRNRCNACSPCMAVQVPTLPGGGAAVETVPTIHRTKSATMASKAGHSDVGATRDFKSVTTATPLDVGGDAPYMSYPNYKPLGWKCRCGNHLFNP